MLREITHIIEPQYVLEGAGVRLRRSLAPSPANPLDPFLLFDNFAFNQPRQGPPVGFPMHPHRGIETVTYMLEGGVFHRDSLGNADLIGAGDIQWMTAGGGILHEEMPRQDENGMVFGFQLWVNLPARLKWTRPRYQGITAAGIPRLEDSGTTVRVIAGEVDGVRGPVRDIAADPLYLDVKLEAGSEFEIPLPPGHTVMAYLFRGAGAFNGQTVAATRMLIFGDGTHLKARASSGVSMRFLLIAGAPFGEPIVPYGPFVMNTAAEIQEAFRDLRDGTFIWNDQDPRFQDT